MSGRADEWSVRLDDDAPQPVRASLTGPGTWSLVIGDHTTRAAVSRHGRDWLVQLEGETHRIVLDDHHGRVARAAYDASPSRELRAVMPGKVIAVLVSEGATVERGDPVLVIEAMKMENDVAASRSGTVTTLAVHAGQPVEAGQLLAVIDDRGPTP